MLRGLSQVIFFADDMAAARRWYSPQFLEIRERVGAFELPDIKHDMPPEPR